MKQKRGRGNKDFKKGDKLVQGVVALKRWGGGGLERPYEIREGWRVGQRRGFVSESVKTGKFVTKMFLSHVE